MTSLEWLGAQLPVLAEVFIGLTIIAFAFVQWRISRGDENQHRRTQEAAHEDRKAADDLIDVRKRDSEMAIWAGAVIDLMAEIETACDPLGKDFVRLPGEFDRLATRASALVDRGRLFFPNVQHAPGERVGLRVELLDHVLRGCYVARHMALHPQSNEARIMRHHVWEARRRFVELVQHETKRSLRSVSKEHVGSSIPLDPRSWNVPTIQMKLPDRT